MLLPVTGNVFKSVISSTGVSLDHWRQYELLLVASRTKLLPLGLDACLFFVRTLQNSGIFFAVGHV